MLSQLEFCILDALADGSEPFSMIYQDAISCERPGWKLETIARGVCDLVSSGMLLLESFDSDSEISKRLVVSADILKNHYEFLDEELEKERPFYYSKGEYFFQMTPVGREEWNKEKYSPYHWTSKSGEL